ncbi:metalloregulator ArsR/SmtB family transcription factor [Sphingobium sp. H39-3-25]|uniref:ArsR/SmtB family transcription factor n=1 Tax=Sphingobium arseniciresistens TaxID=3030834 RepID=UPI0023B89F15|nr:metalloregulator ArsR/SmtB family transcription factor [Sphingobium arseniciresistens]|tara:strand:- start:18030 stop:18443 length:414 start_codon:yes stop_codon:yes gene_type:complete
MDENQALAAFAAISNATRLRIVRLLVVAGADGRSAGAIGEALGCIPPSRLSVHLCQLEQAGLVVSRREGRSLIYSVIFPALSDLVAFLMHDCCEGHCRVCDLAIALFARCTGRPTPAASLSSKDRRSERFLFLDRFR